MSDTGINWYVLIYPAVAIPILILAIVRWNLMRKRQLQRAQQMAQNYNNGFGAQDFVVGNPFDAAHQTAQVYNIEQSAANDNRQNTDIFANQSTTNSGNSPVHDPPPPYSEQPRYTNRRQEKPMDEPPSMIQTKRWF